MASDSGEWPSQSRSVSAPCFSSKRTALSAIYISIRIRIIVSSHTTHTKTIIYDNA